MIILLLIFVFCLCLGTVVAIRSRNNRKGSKESRSSLIPNFGNLTRISSLHQSMNKFNKTVRSGLRSSKANLGNLSKNSPISRKSLNFGKSRSNLGPHKSHHSRNNRRSNAKSRGIVKSKNVK